MGRATFGIQPSCGCGILVTISRSRASRERIASPTVLSSPQGTLACRIRVCQKDHGCLENTSCNRANSSSRFATLSLLVAYAGWEATCGRSTTWVTSRWNICVLPQLMRNERLSAALNTPEGQVSGLVLAALRESLPVNIC